jgi:predicted membrane chloride channel (bestrophin family)
LVSKRQRLKAEGRQARKERIKADQQGGGVGANVPLEITMFMSSWLAGVQRRKTIDVPTTNALLLAVQQMGEALSALERILTTPIPWSYNAHIWAVSRFIHTHEAIMADRFR